MSNLFKTETDHELTEAIARHNNMSAGGIPTWFWCVFLWYASDNFIGYMSSPICFYPLCLIATAGIVCYQLGILWIVIETYKPIAQMQINMVLSKLPGGLKI